MPSKLVDSEEALKHCMSKALLQLQEQGLIFLDLEGVDVSRHGTIALMQVLMPPDPTVYLIDVTTLGSKAFTTDIEGIPDSSLQSILESTCIAKVVFDVRNDCNALFFQFGIKLESIVDLQLLEYVTRSPRGRFVNGLARCVENETAKLSANVRNWKAQKEAGHRLFDPGQGGNFEVFLQRPLPAAIIDYCEQDVLVMPVLLRLYAQQLESHTAAQLQGLVDARVSLGQSADFNGKGRHMALGPRLLARRDVRDHNLSFPMCMIHSSQIVDLCIVDDQPESSITVLDIQPERSLILESNPVAGDHSAQPMVPATQTGPSQLELIHFRMASLEDALSSQEPQCQEASSNNDELVEEREAGRGEEAEDYDDWEEGLQYGHSSFPYGNWGRFNDSAADSDNTDEDFTACDRECGYCGRCSY